MVALWAAAALMPHAALADFAGEAERGIADLEQRLGFVEMESARPDEGRAAAAERKFSEGEIQFLLHDWIHAEVALYDVVDRIEFRRSPNYPRALWYLAESLYQQGNYASAMPYLRQILAIRGAPDEREALVRALDVVIRMRNYAGLDELVGRARQAWADRPPPEIQYLLAKGIYRRRDLATRERLQRAREVLRAVPPPYHLAAAYLEGALLVQDGDLAGAATRFEGCGALEAKDARQKEIRELCFMALGRVYGEMGRIPEALDRYQEIPRDSPRFNEALYEIAWTYVKAGRLEQALRTAAMISDLAPESPLAPEATILQGHLYLRLGRYGEAVETYNRVINQYAPVRDEIDAILTMHEDPVRYFNELIGRSDKAFDVASVLPPVAVKWASTQSEVADALRVVGALDQSQRDIRQGQQIAERIEALLAAGGGLDAFPLLRDGYNRVEAVQNAAAKLEGRIVAEEADLLRGVLSEAARAELAQVRQERQAIEARIRQLPGTPEEFAERLKRISARFAEVDREAFQLGYLIEGCSAAIAGTQLWLDQHRSEVAGTAEGRAEFLEEMRKHREVVAAYEEALRTLRHEIAKAADAATGSELTQVDASLRAEYARSLERERAVLAAVRGALPADDRARFDRLEGLRDRLAPVADRAMRAKARLLGIARGGLADIRGRLDAERRILRLYQGELGGVQGDAKNLVGSVAYRSFGKVRDQFYQLVLKADVGIVDVAWQRKRERVEKIQQLSTQKAADIQGIEDDFRGILKEVQ